MPNPTPRSAPCQAHAGQNPAEIVPRFPPSHSKSSRSPRQPEIGRFTPQKGGKTGGDCRQIGNALKEIGTAPLAQREGGKTGLDSAAGVCDTSAPRFFRRADHETAAAPARSAAKGAVMRVRAVNTAPLPAAPIQIATANAAAIRRAAVLCVALTLALGQSLGAPPAAQAGWADWFSSSDSTKPKANAKKPAKKAGMLQGSAKNTKKPTTATGRMIDSVMSGPNKMMKSSMAALLPGKQPASTKSRTVPRKMVSDQKQPSMLSRLFTAKKPESPQTVTEWLAQPRPKP